MSNLPPNPFNAAGPPQMNINPGQQFNHNQPYSPVPVSQLPPGCSSLKQDANSNSPLPPSSTPTKSGMGHVNNYHQSASNSPAFNHPGMISPPHISLQSSPMRPLVKSGQSPNHNVFLPQNVLTSVDRQQITPKPNASPVSSSNLPLKQINDNAPPLIPSSHRPLLMNGPPMPGPIQPNQYPVTTNVFPPLVNRPPVSATSVPNNSPFGPQGPPVSKPVGPGFPPQSTNSFSGPPQSGPARNSPLMYGPATSQPMSMGPPYSVGLPLGPITSGPILGPPRPFGVNGPHQNGPPNSGKGPTNGPATGPPSGHMGPPISSPPGPTIGHFPGTYNNGPPGMTAPMGVPAQLGLQSPPMGQMPPMPHQQLGQMPLRPDVAPQGSQTGLPPGPPTGPPGPTKGNSQGRYPQMQQSNYGNHQPMIQQQPAMGQYPQQYNTQALAQQMGGLSVTKQGFDQLWGHHMVDLLTCKNILPEYPEDPPEIKLTHQFADSPNCSHEIFRCTVNKIPETNSLLQKSRLPLGILIHPFKDLNHLPVIQCTSIVRCRSCRTYINPFVYFVDAKRWKCNLCYRVNDLPEEFQYDPVSKSYGDPSRRPEIKSATIEFIAPGEYMLRPPQPAVYLFIMDVSQLARDSGYLQVLCETLKNSLDQLPGDARTQVGFVCFDAHVHYYLMSDGLTRPKEMTVLDIDDVFLPSPESLLVNLGERRELIRELLTTLPQRHSGPGVPSCALGAALQAAYKLMAPTGGRITVFQTCLPNRGPGALEPREDPNARSAKDVQHLNPATDFYKRLALDCSGAQIAVDLFLLNSQYSDLATLSGMSKFSAGTVYHLPLFNATRSHQADQFKRILTRYLTRKIGFEAVMRVRCTRGITIHTFHGNFFVRSTDLLSLPNVSPDAGFGMQLTIEESLSDLQQVCFQAALLYTSSKGERRIRVHTLALPIASNLTDVLHSADQQCIVGLLSKMAVDRCATTSMSEAREALMNVGVDALSAHRLAMNLPAGSASSALHAPLTLRLLPLYLLALLKRKAFRTGTSTRLDDRVSDMCDMKTWPLIQLLRAVHPDLYPLIELREAEHDPPRLQLSAERISSSGAYLLDEGDTMIIYVGHQVSPAYLSDTFGVTAFSQLPDEARSLPQIQSDANELLHAFIERLNDDRPYASNLLLLKDNSPSRQLFTERLIEDRVENSFSYYEFLQHIKMQVK